MADFEIENGWLHDVAAPFCNFLRRLKATRCFWLLFCNFLRRLKDTRRF